MTSLRIGLVTQGYDQGSGGVRTVSRWLKGALERLGHEVVVFEMATSRRDPTNRLLIKPWTWTRALVHQTSNPRVFHVGAAGGELEVLRYFPRRELTDHLNTFDVVQVVGGSPAIGWVARKVTRPLFVQMATLVGWERQSILRSLPWWSRLRFGAMTKIVSRFEGPAMRLANLVFVENATTLTALEARGVNAVEAPPGIDTARFCPDNPGWRASSYILSVGRLGEPRKGYPQMLRAYVCLKQMMMGRCPPLVLVGSGTLQTDVERLIGTLGLLDGVHVKADVDTETLITYYRNASVFWTTSFEEGLGISMLEAMACGVPVVAFETAGSRSVVTPEVGYLVSRSGGECMEMARLTKLVLDGEGERLAAAARRRVTRGFDTSVAILPYACAYMEAASRLPLIRAQEQ